MILAATPANIKRAAEQLCLGGVVAFPTETVYGLGADATEEQAVAKIFEIKNRPRFNPLIVHLHDPNKIDQVADFKSDASLKRTVEKLLPFWPGPLSLVLPRHPSIPSLVSAGLSSIAVRIPAHDVALALLKTCDIPVAAPSANLFSSVSPTTAAHVEESLGGRVDLILDGGPCSLGVESTVLSLIDVVPTVLRPGGVTVEQLQEVLGDVRVKPTRPVSTSNGDITGSHKVAQLSPGMLREHYSPRTPMILKDQANTSRFPSRVGIIAFKNDPDFLSSHNYTSVKILSESANLKEIASKLFASIRDMDNLGLDLIVVDTCAEVGLGRAIMDRLRKASAGTKK